MPLGAGVVEPQLKPIGSPSVCAPRFATCEQSRVIRPRRMVESTGLGHPRRLPALGRDQVGRRLRCDGSLRVGRPAWDVRGRQPVTRRVSRMERHRAAQDGFSLAAERWTRSAATRRRTSRQPARSRPAGTRSRAAGTAWTDTLRVESPTMCRSPALLVQPMRWCRPSRYVCCEGNRCRTNTTCHR